MMVSLYDPVPSEFALLFTATETVVVAPGERLPPLERDTQFCEADAVQAIELLPVF
jgi:hypothetical protein